MPASVVVARSISRRAGTTDELFVSCRRANCLSQRGEAREGYAQGILSGRGAMLRHIRASPLLPAPGKIPRDSPTRKGHAQKTLRVSIWLDGSSALFADGYKI